MRSLVLLILWLAAGLAPAAAATTGCREAIVASARASHPESFDPPRRYDVEAKARSLALAAWRAQVKADCPAHSTDWARASARSIECEGVAGGLSCEARAVPRRR